MLFSIIVPTHNRKDDILNLIENVEKLDFPKTDYELIVTDDGSTDGTVEALKAKNIRVIELGIRCGPAKARNTGVKEAKGTYVLFTDSDCLLPSNILSKYKEAFEKLPEVVGVGGGIVNDGKGIFEKYETYIYKKYEKEPREYISDKRDELPFALGNISYKKSEIPQFNEIPFNISGEDALLKESVLRLGKKLVYVPINVIHKKRYTFQGFYKQSLERGASMLMDSKRNGHLQSKLSIICKLLFTPVYFIYSLFKLKNVELAFVDTLFFKFRNLGKLKFYEKVVSINI